MSHQTPGICLVGLGPHARRIYYKYIQSEVNKGTVRFDTLVDVEPRRENIETFLNEKDVRPAHTLFCPAKGSVAPKQMAQNVVRALDQSIKEGGISYAIVSTEPKAHKVYIEYFLKKGIPVLTDKPLTAPIGSNWSRRSAAKIYSDALELEALSRATGIPLYVQAQRREHPAYVYIFEQIRTVVEEYSIPITFFTIYHSDGTWSMPGEFLSRENHPYKYGYGKILHSGYHFVDLLAQLIEINASLVPHMRTENTTRLLRPHEHYRQIRGGNLYEKLFGVTTKEPRDFRLGEVDSYSNFTLTDARTGYPMTYGHIDLLQSGFSKRAWHALPNDTYKGNGRVRHEYMNVHVGPLLNIQLHSYQADESDKGAKDGVGGEEHLEVYEFRNEKLIGGKPFEVIDFGKVIRERSHDDEVYIGQNEVARHTIFQQFLGNQPSRALIGGQMRTNAILSSMFTSAITGRPSRSKI